jgi:methyl-accepting chemotaxis protein
MLSEIYNNQLQTMATTMKMTVAQQALYDGYFAAQSEDYDFLKKFLIQTMDLARVDDVLVMYDSGEVVLRAASEQRGEKMSFNDLLKPIISHAPITDKQRQLDKVILTSLMEDGDRFKLLTMGPVLDVETIVGTIVFVKELDAGFLADQKQYFDNNVEISIASAQRISASTLSDFSLPQRLDKGENAFELKVKGRPYRHRFISLEGGRGFLGLSYDRSENLAARSSIRKIMAAIFFVALGLVIGIIMINANRIIGSVNTLAGYAEKISEGDLSSTVEDLGDDEVGQMSRAFNRMISSLSEIAGKIDGAARNLTENAETLSVTTDQLAQGASEQSGQTAQAATAMEEMSQTIMEVAKNAGTASEASREASEIASKGRETVDQSVSGMTKIADTVTQSAQSIEELGRSSDEIGNIISVIDDIADQTNLLALNAAIEAARAGEQGRGFAVVADEVRKLAERTSKATKEIAGMIKKIQADIVRSVESMDVGKKEVETGVQLVEEAKNAMTSIVNASDRSMDMVQQIATATEEQSAASEQVSTTMENISGATKTYQDSSQQIQRAAQDLAGMGSDLKEATSWFKLNGRGAFHRDKRVGMQKKVVKQNGETIVTS